MSCCWEGIYCAVLERKKNIPTPWTVIGNSWVGRGGGGGGVLKEKKLEAKYEGTLEFPGGRGRVQNKKKLLRGEYGYFLELIICYRSIFLFLFFFFFFPLFALHFRATVTCSSIVFSISESYFWLIWNPRKSIWKLFLRKS